MDENTIKKFVRERYAGIARQGTSCCGGGAPIEVTARRDGVDVDGLIRALNTAVEGPQAGAALKK